MGALVSGGHSLCPHRAGEGGKENGNGGKMGSKREGDAQPPRRGMLPPPLARLHLNCAAVGSSCETAAAPLAPALASSLFARLHPPLPPTLSPPSSGGAQKSAGTLPRHQRPRAICRGTFFLDFRGRGAAPAPQSCWDLRPNFSGRAPCATRVLPSSERGAGGRRAATSRLCSAPVRRCCQNSGLTRTQAPLLCVSPSQEQALKFCRRWRTAERDGPRCAGGRLRGGAGRRERACA